MSERYSLRWIVALLAACLAVSSSRAKEPGVVTGTADKPAAVTAVWAIDRTHDKRFPGTMDDKSGKFVIDDLPLGETYDCVIEFGPDARVEGVDLKVPHSDYEVEQPMTKEDVKTLTDSAKALDKFADDIEVVTILGNIQHAVVLLNKKRTTPFINAAPGEMIWRVELWRFERPDDVWVKVQDELFTTIRRERLQKTDFAKKSLTLDPTLGRVQLTDKQAKVDLGKVVLPSGDPGVRLRAEGGKDK